MALDPHAEPLHPDLLAADALSIGDLYRRVDRVIRGTFPAPLWITGEIRSIKVLPRGHCFIDLVDPARPESGTAPTLAVKCWATRWRGVRSTLDRLGIVLEAGMVVRMRGEVQLYKGRGTIEFVLADLDSDALLGKVAAARARLIRTLVDEELFDRNRGVTLTVPPLRVGLVASPGTEGYADFLGQLEASGMAFAVRTAPTQVQGRRASSSVASAIRRLQSARCDLIAVVRGGGSKADLATFDTEPVARAICDSAVPVWTGIGHTGDLSVADEVASRAFITPTECGRELVGLVTDYWQTVQWAGTRITRLAAEGLVQSEHQLDRHRRRLVAGARSQLGRHGERLTNRSGTLRASARNRAESHRLHLGVRANQLGRSAVRCLDAGGQMLRRQTLLLAGLPLRRLEQEARQIEQWQRLLGAYDYRRQLERGYSVTRDEAGRVLRSASMVGPGSRLHTHLADGEVASLVVDDADRVGSAGSTTDRPDRGRT